MANLEELLIQSPDPHTLAQAFLNDYFKDKQTTYPINPFQMLTDLGVPFVFRSFKNYEGVYIPQEDENDLPVIGINIKRPITRQRYTAAHELCHHIKDKGIGIMCSFGSKSEIEDYAEKFAAELLMPNLELNNQTEKYIDNGYVSFENVLLIAHYFGVSFEACLFRIAYVLRKIEGATNSDALKKRVKNFAPSKKRLTAGLDYVNLYEGLFNAAKSNLAITPNLNIQLKFQNEYVYNDSRLEGVDIELEVAADIVADIRLKKQESDYCNSQNKAIIEVAGHAVMYGCVFEKAMKERISIYDSLVLNGKLFSCAPYPEGGGKFRETNTLVIGGKFETIDYHDIPNEIFKLEENVQFLEENKSELQVADYIEKVVDIHHRMTVIHPFSDGNGRTTRAFANLLLIRNRIPPMYFKVERKKEYIEALGVADKCNDFAPLYETFFRAILSTHSELTSTSFLK